MVFGWGRRSVLFRDGSVGLLTAVLGLLGVAFDSASDLPPWSRLAGIGIALASGLAVALGRRHSEAALVVALGCALLSAPARYEVGTDFMAAVLCGYTATAYPNWFTPRRVFVATTATAAGASLLAIPFLNITLPEAAGTLLLFLMLATLTVGLGTSVRNLRQTADELATRNAELERLRAAEAQRAVAEERTRIARELHDLVAHHVSAIVLSARAGVRAGGANLPDSARSALQTITDSGTEALAAMRKLVTVLRAGDEDAELAPQPGLAELGDLVDSFRRIGLRLELSGAGVDRPVPSDVGLAAYRIIQEALTNVLRHTPTRRAWVTIAADDGLTVTVDDNGGGPQPVDAAHIDAAVSGVLEGTSAGGHGLLGMRERATLAGGRLTLEPSPQGGWRVRAWLPVPAAGPVIGTSDGAVVRWQRVS